MTCRRRATTGHRASRALAVLTLSALLCTSFAGIAHAATLRHRLLHLINHSRTLHDVRPVKLNLRLSRDAMTHTRTMLQADRLFDFTNLADVLAPYDWKRLGADVVGCGETLHEMHRALMRHALHRKIILNADVRRVGIGVIKDTGRSLCGRNAVWATEIYYG
ncbi:MAG: CAP domain-containing protein [Actinomycetota bacterium]